jgi:hypothetical protein
MATIRVMQANHRPSVYMTEGPNEDDLTKDIVNREKEKDLVVEIKVNGKVVYKKK